jgi:ornithine carbamoyltransferase
MSETNGTLRHFLDLDQFEGAALRAMLIQANALRVQNEPGLAAGKVLVMIFEKPSTRTRVSFEVGMKELGGSCVVLGERDSQLGRGETIADTARVLSRYADAIMIRTDDPGKLTELAEYASVPVINGLTDASHPCQIMADIMTFEDHLGAIEGKQIAWIGDGNNVAVSWLHAAVRLGFQFRCATPASLSLPKVLIEWAHAEGADILVTDDAAAAAAGADCIVTDTWVSMGDDEDRARRNQLLAPYQVDAKLMAKAGPDALFMHCLPAHRGDEVTEEVIDGAQSVVWDEAENRLHAQKGILAWCLGAG